ncbi:TM2 domain-containing protein [Candidatus Berkelbacteria bacterium]|nr:TM2 domain-containing protein [Candidatus Berkelbacteria bacterium]
MEPVPSFVHQFQAAIGSVEAQASSAYHGEKTDITGELQPLAAVYERVRTLLDYQEERFIRRLAIRRILNRQVLLEQRRTGIGAELLAELVRAAYLESGSFPVTSAETIDQVLTIYLQAIPALSGQAMPTERIKQQRRLLGIAAAQIEDSLRSPAVETVLVSHLTTEIRSYDTTLDSLTSQSIALRALLNADAELIVWRTEGAVQTSRWQQFRGEPTVGAPALLMQLATVERLCTTDSFESMVRRFRKLVPPYRLLTLFASQSRETIDHLLNTPDALRMGLRDLATKRMARTRERIRRSMLQATLYLFVTKVVVGIAVEVPFDLVVVGHLVALPLLINVLMPPTLMICSSIGIRPPSSLNLELLVQRTVQLLSETLPPPLPTVSRTSVTRRSALTTLLFWIFFGGLYLGVFGGIIWLLRAIGFNVMSILVFLFFASVVGFFAFRIRANAREFSLQSERTGLLVLIIDFLSLPFLQVGRRLSLTVRQLNVVLFVMDFLIEAPFKLFLRSVEDWFAFLREQRDELH